MAVREALLAILRSGPKYGYQLKTEFESYTGKVWSLNIGQVYTTLQRLERDGLVEEATILADGQRLYRSTDAGRRHTAEWFSEPVDRDVPRRDELILKLMLAIRLLQDPAPIIQVQRGAALKRLQDYTRLKAEPDPSADLAWLIMLDSTILQTEAEVRWLDLVEARLAQSGGSFGEPPQDPSSGANSDKEAAAEWLAENRLARP